MSHMRQVTRNQKLFCDKSVSTDYQVKTRAKITITVSCL